MTQHLQIAGRIERDKPGFGIIGNEVLAAFLNFTELVMGELRKLPQPALH